MKILYICGTLNQTTMMHKVSKHLEEHESVFTPYYSDGAVRVASNLGLLDKTIIGKGKFFQDTVKYLNANQLQIDFEGKNADYDLVVTCNDLIIQKNIRDKKIVLVQEGMTDDPDWILKAFKLLGIPQWLAGNTAVMGISDAYAKFCVASEGYKDFFVKKGIRPEKLTVTGIPNFDNAKQYLNNSFPHKNYVLVATSDTRETLKYENRRKTIEDAFRIAAGRPVIFKLHPNENAVRARAEIAKYAPGSLVFQDENVHELIANCNVLITRFSTVVYTGLALGKEVYSEYETEFLKRLAPIQNGGKSGEQIAKVCRELLQ